jgi:hypothetical protein
LDLQIDVAPRSRSGNGERKRVERGDGCARVEAESCASEGPRGERAGDVKVLAKGVNNLCQTAVRKDRAVEPRRIPPLAGRGIPVREVSDVAVGRN